MQTNAPFIILAAVCCIAAGVILAGRVARLLVQRGAIRGARWAIEVNRVCRVALASSVVAMILFAMIGVGVLAFAVFVGYLGPAFVDALRAIWGNLVDAYNADRMVKFIVWIAAAAGAAFATMIGGVLAVGWLSAGLEKFIDSVTALRMALKRKESALEADEAAEILHAWPVRETRWLVVAAGLVVSGGLALGLLLLLT